MYVPKNISLVQHIKIGFLYCADFAIPETYISTCAT